MNRLLLVALFLSLTCLTPARAKMLGDFNGDGRINILDVVTFLNHVGGRQPIAGIGAELPEAGPLSIPESETDYIPVPTQGAAGANIGVSGYIIKNVHDILMGAAFNAFLKARESLAQGFSGRVEGDSSGYAEVAGVFSPKPIPGYVNITAVFHDYSDDGETYISGRLQYGGVDLDRIISIPIINIHLVGCLNYAGKYKGSNQYAFGIGTLETGEFFYTGFYMASGMENFGGEWKPGDTSFKR